MPPCGSSDTRMVEKHNLDAVADGCMLSSHPGQTTCTDKLMMDCHVTSRRPMPLSTDEDLPGVCAGCGRRIEDRYYLLAVDKQWHVNCLKCFDCKLLLDSELTCFAREGYIYCKEDYYRRYAIKRCSRCHLGIAANELVMRARDAVYHLSCFTCSSCNRPLTPGEQFGMKESLVYCRSDYEVIFQGEFLNMSPEMGAGSGGLPYYNGVGAVQKGRPRKRKSPLSDMDGCPTSMVMENPDRPGEVMDRDDYQHQSARQKRVRTSFKHHQLRTMKSYFALNHNPDAKDLKQLAQKTGLSKRVLQVWFQNARAKYRRNLLKQQQDQGKDDQGQGGGTDGEKMDDSSSMHDLTQDHSPGLSDISSSPSLSDLHTPTLEPDQNTNSISDLFSNSISSIN